MNNAWKTFNIIRLLAKNSDNNKNNNDNNNTNDSNNNNDNNNNNSNNNYNDNNNTKIIVSDVPGTKQELR